MAMLAMLVVVTACRVDVVVDVNVTADGSGDVTVDVVFDEGVVAAVPDLDERIRLGDLSDAGWDLTSAVPDDGGLRVTARRSFSSIEQLDSVLAGIDGPDGLFAGSGLVAERRDEVVTYRFHMDVSLDRTVTDMVNPAIAAALGGEPFGIPTAELEQRAGGPLDEAVSLVVRASVPGGSGELPESGVLTLAEVGDRRFEVTGQVVDEAIRAADADADAARAAVPRAVGWLLIWWFVLGVVTVIVIWLSRRR